MRITEKKYSDGSASEIPYKTGFFHPLIMEAIGKIYPMKNERNMACKTALLSIVENRLFIIISIFYFLLAVAYTKRFEVKPFERQGYDIVHSFADLSLLYWIILSLMFAGWTADILTTRLVLGRYFADIIFVDTEQNRTE